MDQAELAGQQYELNVGRRLRILREKKGLSLRSLAERCGLSINAISRIERGSNSPTVASLHRLAQALDVPITLLFEDEHDQMVVFVRKGREMRSKIGEVLVESLALGLHNQQLEPFRLTIDPGVDNTHDPMVHAGQEFVHCLSGQVEYFLGERMYHMHAGDSLLFEASLPHCWRNTSSETAIMLAVLQTSEHRLLARQVHLQA